MGKHPKIDAAIAATPDGPDRQALIKLRAMLDDADDDPLDLLEMEIAAGEHFQNPEEEDFCVCGVAGQWETADLWVCYRTAPRTWLHTDSGLTEPPSYSGPVPYGFMQGH